MNQNILIFFLMLFMTIYGDLIAPDTSTLTVLIGAKLCVYCQTTACHCPATESLLNCSSYVHNIPYILNCTNMTVWKTVDFSLRHLKVLNSKTLLSLRMERLILKSNYLTYIHDDTFDSIGHILVELDLETNHILNLSANWLNSKLIRLERLNLAFNHLHEFDTIQDVQLPNLRTLNLSHNRISTFPKQIHNWTSLISLDLSFNQLYNIPRLALSGLGNLTWLSLASNRNLSCVIQDSFKNLNSLEYLDLSNTNLIELDACIFNQLSSLKVLSMENIQFNCTSCWLPIARRQNFKIVGHCFSENKLQKIDSLTDKQIQCSKTKSSINCTIDYCEPGFIIQQQRLDKQFLSSKDSFQMKNDRTIKYVISIALTIVTLSIAIIITIFLCRWRQNGNLCCFSETRKTTNKMSTTTNTKAEETRRQRQQIIDANPAVIESVVTHGANMNVPSHPHRIDAYGQDEISNKKRKLYNPMFADSPTSDTRHQQQNEIVSSDNASQTSEFYCEKL